MAGSRKFRALTGVLILVAALFIGAGIVYMTRTVGNLPAFFPGHVNHHSRFKHGKYGVGLFILAGLCLLGAWFATKPTTVKQQTS